MNGGVISFFNIEYTYFRISLAVSTSPADAASPPMPRHGWVGSIFHFQWIIRSRGIAIPGYMSNRSTPNGFAVVPSPMSSTKYATIPSSMFRPGTGVTWPSWNGHNSVVTPRRFFRL